MPRKPGRTNADAPGFLRRAAALLYDSLLLLAVLFLATAIALPFNAGKAFSPDQILYPIYLLTVSFVFFGWFWTHGGQTLGLRSWKMKLVGTDRLAVGWKQAALRFVCAILSWLCLGIGFFWIIVDPKRRSWHDRLSKTRLIIYRETP